MRSEEDVHLKWSNVEGIQKGSALFRGERAGWYGQVRALELSDDGHASIIHSLSSAGEEHDMQTSASTGETSTGIPAACKMP
jgi:hypothetical protein